MKFTISMSCLVLLASLLSVASGNAQAEPQLQPLPQPICLATQPSERSTTTSEPAVTPRSSQVQQTAECALKTQPQPVRAELPLLEHDRLILERETEKVIPS